VTDLLLVRVEVQMVELYSFVMNYARKKLKLVSVVVVVMKVILLMPLLENEFVVVVVVVVDDERDENNFQFVLDLKQ
jgi:hypothetical protein